MPEAQPKAPPTLPTTIVPPAVARLRHWNSGFFTSLTISAVFSAVFVFKLVSTTFALSPVSRALPFAESIAVIVGITGAEYLVLQLAKPSLSSKYA